MPVAIRGHLDKQVLHGSVDVNQSCGCTARTTFAYESGSDVVSIQRAMFLAAPLQPLLSMTFETEKYSKVVPILTAEHKDLNG